MGNGTDDLSDFLYEAASVVLEIEEVEPREKYLKEICKTALQHKKSLFDQMDKKISLCKDDSERQFVYDSTLTFLLHSFFHMCELLYQKDKLKECFVEKLIEDIQYRLDEIKERNPK